MWRTKNLIPYISVALAVACGGESLIDDPTLGTKMLAIQAVHHGTPDDKGMYPDYLKPDDTKQFKNAQGVTIKLRQAAISWGNLVLISEGNDPECTVGSEAEINIERVEDLLTQDRNPLTLATDEIPDVTYCRYEVELQVDNTMSPGLGAVSEAEGYAAYVAGTWRNGTEEGAFAIGVAQDIVVPALFMTKELDTKVPHPLHYHDAETIKTIVFGNKFDRWFDDIDFSASAAAQAATIEINIVGSLHQHLGSTHAH